MKELQKLGPAIIHTDRVETPTLGPDPNDSTKVSGGLVVKLVMPPESSAVLKTPANDETSQPLTKADQRANQILELWKSEAQPLSGAETARHLGIKPDDSTFRKARTAQEQLEPRRS
jgi:hypothetical protein